MTGLIINRLWCNYNVRSGGLRHYAANVIKMYTDRVNNISISRAITVVILLTFLLNASLNLRRDSHRKSRHMKKHRRTKRVYGNYILSSVTRPLQRLIQL